MIFVDTDEATKHLPLPMTAFSAATLVGFDLGVTDTTWWTCIAAGTERLPHRTARSNITDTSGHSIQSHLI